LAYVIVAVILVALSDVLGGLVRRRLVIDTLPRLIRAGSDPLRR
jgi:hypothetical protein